MTTIILVLITVFTRVLTPFWQHSIMIDLFLKIITLPARTSYYGNLNTTSLRHFLKLKDKLYEILWWKWFWRQIWDCTIQFSKTFKLGYLRRQIEHQRKKMYC